MGVDGERILTGSNMNAKRGNKCEYRGCGLSRPAAENLGYTNFRMFRFKTKPNALRTDWIVNSGADHLADLPDHKLQNKYICCLHFNEKDYRSSEKKYLLPDEKPALYDTRDACRDNSIESNSAQRNFLQELSKKSTTRNHTEDTPSIQTNENSLQLEINYVEPSNVSTTLPLDMRLASEAMWEDLGCSALGDEIDIAQIERSDTPPLIPDLIPPINFRATVKFTPTKMKQRRKIERISKTNDNLRRRNTRLNRKIKNIECRSLYKEEIVEACKSLMENAPFILFNMQLKYKDYKRQPAYTPEEKDLALKLFYNSARCYRYMRQELKFHLPSVATIRRWTRFDGFQPGVCNVIFDRLEEKLKTMKSNERKCVLIVDEIGLKRWLVYNRLHDLFEGYTDLGNGRRAVETASHASVFLLRGLLSDWKQPLSYVLTNGPIKARDLEDLLKQILDKLISIGFDVRAVVCDQGTNNQALIRNLGVNKSKPFFHHNGKKISVIYDVPHLIKSIRNNLMKYNFKTKDGVVSWKWIRDLFFMENKQGIKTALKLTI
ncbi:hypothetical protein B566_EDAN015138 [Ephemera danica]|nr:hypothetical protein B566_EDAN015138 [Ephemera danica]